MKKTFLALIAFLIAFTTAPAAQPVVKIGVIAPLSGMSPEWGENLRNGVLLAQTELLNQDKSRHYRYEFVIEDGQADNVASIKAFNKLTGVDRVHALISVFDNIAQVIKPLAVRQKIIHFAIAIDPNAADGQYNFTHWPTCRDEVAAWLAECKRRNIHRVSVIGLNHQFPHSVKDEIIRQGAAQVTLTGQHFFSPEERDFRTLIAKVVGEKPDAYLILAFPPTLELLTGQMKQAGLNNLTSIESFAMSQNPARIEGSWFVTGADPSPDFIQSYTKRFKSRPKWAAYYGYDIVQMLVRAYETSGAPASIPSTAQVAAALLKTHNFISASGTLTITPQGVVQSPVVVKEVKNGSAAVISTAR
jgi:branched-chain amino acid transport system substrate-binding protein